MLSSRYFFLLVSALAFLLFLPTPLLAEDDQQELGEGRRVRDPDRYRTDQAGAIELRAGPYRPRVDAEFAGTATPFQDIFGTGSSVSFGVEGDWQALRIPHFGSFGPGFGISYVQYSAFALREADPSERSAQPTRFWMLPTYGVAVLRIDFLARDFSIPIVPYAKGGLALTLWNAVDPRQTTTEGLAGGGAETGTIAMVGGMLLLDFFAPQAAIDMDNSTGVNHAYLFGEWVLSDTSSFGNGLQTGVNTWQAGITLEF